MKDQVWAMVAGLVLCGLVVSPAGALTLEPVFRVTQIQGQCMVLRPDASAFVEAQEGRTYPYGSRIQTGPESTALIVMAENNTCRVFANANFVFAEAARARRSKQILLDEGEVEVRLTAEFHSGGNTLSIETATMQVVPVGTRLRAANQIQDDLNVTIVRCLDGMLRISGFGYQAQIGKDQWVSSIAPFDRSFLRIKNLKGMFGVTIPEGEGLERTVATEEGMTLKIWQQEVPDSDLLAISIAITDKDGKLVETVVATLPRHAQALARVPLDDLAGPEWPPERRRPNFTDVVESEEIWLTTTTIENPTPVGRR